MLLVTQFKPAFAFGQQLRQNEMYLPSIELDPQYFSDVGYRYRVNNFGIEDDWWALSDTPDAGFTDYVFFNKDTFEQDPEDEKSTVL